jgi:hypothetical protein
MTATPATADHTTDPTASVYRAAWMSTATGRVYVSPHLTETDAVQVQETAALYANLAPLGVTPAPDWTRYRTRPALAEEITRARAAVRAEMLAVWDDDRTGYPYVTDGTAWQAQRWASITGQEPPAPGDKPAMAAFMDAARTAD